MNFKCLFTLLCAIGGLQGQRVGDERNQTDMARMGRFLATPLDKWFHSCLSRQPSINFITSNFRDCIQRHGFPYDAIDLDSRMDVSYRSRTGADNTDETCSMIKALADCAHEVTDNLGACLSPSAMREVKTLFGSFHRSVCSGKMLLKKMFGSSSALECYANHADSTFTCMRNKPELMDQWFSKINSTSKTIYAEEYCTIQKEFKKCNAILHHRCPNNVTPELFDAAISSMDGDSPRCNSAAVFTFNMFNMFAFILASVLLRKFTST